MTGAQTKRGSLQPWVISDFVLHIVLCIATLINALQWDAITKLKNEFDLLRAQIQATDTPAEQAPTPTNVR